MIIIVLGILGAFVTESSEKFVWYTMKAQRFYVGSSPEDASVWEYDNLIKILAFRMSVGVGHLALSKKQEVRE